MFTEFHPIQEKIHILNLCFHSQIYSITYFNLIEKIQKSKQSIHFNLIKLKSIHLKSYSEIASKQMGTWNSYITLAIPIV